MSYQTPGCENAEPILDLGCQKTKTNLHIRQPPQYHTETTGTYFKEHKSQTCNGKCNNNQRR